jgi:hypothetical protein
VTHGERIRPEEALNMNLRAGMLAVVGLLVEEVAIDLDYPTAIKIGSALGSVAWATFGERRRERPLTARDRAVRIPLLLISAFAVWWIGGRIEQFDPLHPAIPLCALLGMLLSGIAAYQVVALAWDVFAPHRREAAVARPSQD